MNILIIGNGGREHALAWKAAQSVLVEIVFVTPGNAGTERENKVRNVAIGVNEIDQLKQFALDNAVDLTIVGPEVPLVAGLCDQFREVGLACFGPSALAAQLEGSKSFAKAFMQRHDIPTAHYDSFSDIDLATEYLHQCCFPIVLKADGLAAGKGVVIAQDINEAVSTVKDMLSGNAFGKAGSRVVIEEFLQGEEVSFICMVDGLGVLPMASSQDHKAAYDGDLGPNTGGMGAYSPAPLVDDALAERIMQRVIRPTVQGMMDDGMPYNGFLYAGLIVDESGEPRVIEFNCRFGDPEAQPVLSRLQSDLVAHCLAATRGELNKEVAEWDSRACLGVVMAAEGYPDSYDKGHSITGIELANELADVKVFQAGTAMSGDGVVTAGGRVLCVTALGDSVLETQALAYRAVDKINWPGAWCRRDIGYRAVAREVEKIGL